MITLTPSQRYRLDQLIARACEKFDVTTDELSSHSTARSARHDPAVLARSAIYLHTPDVLGLSQDQIVSVVGGQHRSSVSNGVGMIRTWMRGDRLLAERVDSLRLFAISLLEVERLSA